MKINPVVEKTFPFIAFIYGMWYFCLRILGSNFEYIPGDLGDSRFINYLLEHGYRWLTGDVSSFWNAEFMYPFKNVIALSDTMLGTMPIYSAWRLFGFSPESSYQLWWVSICTLNFWVSYLIFKKWFSRADIALILAWIFAFTLFNISQLNYMQFIIRFIVPVVFYAAYKMVSTPSIKYLSIYCFGVVIQFYCVMYTGFYLLYFSVLFLLIYCLVSVKWISLLFYFNKKQLAYTLSVFAISLLAMLWLINPYLEMSKIIGMLQYAEVKPNIPYFKDYLFPHDSSLTWKFLCDFARPDVPTWWLHNMFGGIIPLLVIIISPFYLINNRYKKINTPTLLKAFIITSVIIILFHIQTIIGHSLYPLFFELPGMKSIRVLTRFINVEIFLLLIIFGYFLLKVKSKYILLFMPLIFLDNLFSPEYIPREEKAELIKRKEIVLTELEKRDYRNYKALAFLDTTQQTFVTNIDMMLVAQSVGMKTINGYSSHCPQGLFEFTKMNVEAGLYTWLDSQKINREEVLLVKLNRN